MRGGERRIVPRVAFKRRRSHKEAPNKYWALSPKPGAQPLDKIITKYNVEILARTSIIGIAQTRKLAKQRRDERAARLGDQAAHEDYHAHVYDAQHALGAIAIIGNAVYEEGVPQMWSVDTYIGKAVPPLETQLLPMERVLHGVICTDETLRLKNYMLNLLRERQVFPPSNI